MKRLESLIAGAAIAAMLVCAWPGGAREPSHVPSSWRAPPRPAPHCGAALTIVAVLADPAHVPDADGELVRLRNLEPEALELSGWSLVRGDARRALDDVVVDAGAVVELVGHDLRPLRLPNRGGEIRVRDPCGIVTRFAWPRAEPGHIELEPSEAGGAM